MGGGDNDRELARVIHRAQPSPRLALPATVRGDWSTGPPLPAVSRLEAALAGIPETLFEKNPRQNLLVLQYIFSATFNKFHRESSL